MCGREVKYLQIVDEHNIIRRCQPAVAQLGVGLTKRIKALIEQTQMDYNKYTKGSKNLLLDRCNNTED